MLRCIRLVTAMKSHSSTASDGPVDVVSGHCPLGPSPSGTAVSCRGARHKPIQKQHVEVEVEIQRTAEALDQGDCPGLGPRAGKPGLLDQVGGDAAVDDAEHPAHDGRAAREQQTQGIRDTQYPLAHRLFARRRV